MYKREKKSWLKHIDFTLLDIVCLQLALIAAYVMRLGWHLPYSSDPYERLAFVMALIDICVVFFLEPYNRQAPASPSARLYLPGCWRLRWRRSRRKSIPGRSFSRIG